MKYKDSCYYIAGPLTRKGFDTELSSIAYLCNFFPIAWTRGNTKPNIELASKI